MTNVLRHPLVRYALAVVLCLATVAYGHSLFPVMGVGIVLLFVLTVLLCAAAGGLGPGLLAAVLSVVSLDWFFLSPTESLRVVAAADAALLVVYAGVAVTAAGVVGVLRRWFGEQEIRAQRAEGMVVFLDRQLGERDEELRSKRILRLLRKD